MNWILEHLQLIIVVAGVIAYWINQRAREKAGQETDYDEDGIPENRPAPRAETRELAPVSRDGADPEQAERVRRIQEEIRRKIAERRGQAAPPMPAPTPAPPPFDPFRPVFQETPRPSTPPPLRPAEPVVVREPVSAYDDSAALERQRKLAEQLEQLEEQRRATRRAAQSAFDSTEQQAAATQTEKAAGVGARRLSAELRDPRSLRRAFVLREVLDAPVALR